MTPEINPDLVPDAPTHDFNLFLHELRDRELRRLPPGAKTVLSGGCSGGWYFRWVKDCYPGLERHIGVEAYSPRPNDLPPEADWISNYLGNMHDVPDASVDLVFAGQTTEHMWPDDLASFLCESHRVLRPDGVIALDSPNRRITQMLGWHQPQHTAEHNVNEIVGMIGAAGFDRVEVRGVWLCYGREDHLLLPLNPEPAPPGWGWKRRVALSAGRPEDCFVWWLEARRSAAAPERDRVAAVAHWAYNEAFAAAVTREFVGCGRAEGSGRNRLILNDVGQAGCVNYGPYIPLQPGVYTARFGIGLRPGGPDLPPHAIVCELEATHDCGRAVLAKRAIRLGELRRGQLIDFDLPFRAGETCFGCEFRVLSTGLVPLVFRSHRDLVEVDRHARLLAA